MRVEFIYVMGGNIELEVVADVELGEDEVINAAMEDCQPAGDAEADIISVETMGADVEVDDVYIKERGDIRCLLDILKEKAIEEAV